MINLTKLKVTGKPKRTGLPLRKTKISQRCLWACSSAGASHAPLATASSSAAPFPFLCCLPVALLHFSHNLLLTAVVLSPKTSGIPLPMIINLTLPSFAPFTLWGTLRGGLHKLLPGCSFLSCFELFDYRGSTKELCFWNSSKWSAVPKVQVPQILVLSDSPHCYFFAILLKKISYRGYEEPLPLRASLQVQHHSSPDPMEPSQCHKSKRVAQLGTSFSSSRHPTASFETSVSGIHLVSTTLTRKFSSRFVSCVDDHLLSACREDTLLGGWAGHLSLKKCSSSVISWRSSDRLHYPDNKSY